MLFSKQAPLEPRVTVIEPVVTAPTVRPTLAPPPTTSVLECEVGVIRPIGTFDRRAAIARGVLAFGFLFGLTYAASEGGSLMLAPEAIGPIITVAAWTAVLLLSALHNIRAAKRGDPHRVAWVEMIPIVSGLALLQLFLDFHTPYAGDITIGVLHAPLVVIGARELVRARR